MKTYKARFKEMNAYYLERIQTLQRRLREEKDGLKQIEQMYQGYIAQIIIKYGLNSDHVYLEPDFPVLDYMIFGERLQNGRTCISVIEIKKEAEEDKKTDENPE